MTSKANANTGAFVWIWLPGSHEPVVAGKLTAEGKTLVFNYGKKYLDRQDAIAIYEPELPLKQGRQPLLSGLEMPACIRDAAPDAWGRRVIINRILGLRGKDADDAQIDELTFLLESGSDRIGALDFQSSPEKYEPRISGNASLQELLRFSELVERGDHIPNALELAVQHGSPIGGARPKALIDDKDKKYIAKFSSTADDYSVVKAEYIATRLAKIAGLNAVNVILKRVMHKDVILIERFDRIKSGNEWHRKSMVSALTMFGLDEMMASYASYEDLGEIIRHRFTEPVATLKELFGRLVFNILIGNTDDHARNHAAFWDGKMLTLTPAYDICPQRRTGGEASQSMLISGRNNKSRILSCIEAAKNFLLSEEVAIEIIEKQIRCICENWDAVCKEAELNEVDKNLFWRRQILHPYAFEGLEEKAPHLINLLRG